MKKKFSTAGFINTPVPIQTELRVLFGKFDELNIFDIGSCDGIDSIRYSNLFPNALIYSFEPVPDNIKQIRENLRIYNKGKIRVMEEALSDVVGHATFHVSSGNPEDVDAASWNYGNKSSSLLEPSEKMREFIPWLQFTNTISVRTNTLSNFCSENRISQIDFVHMDVQGAELMVLKGAASFINKIKAIWLETGKVELYKRQPLRNDVELFMEQNRFAEIKDSFTELSGDQMYINRFYFDVHEIQRSLKIRSSARRLKHICRKIIHFPAYLKRQRI